MSPRCGCADVLPSACNCVLADSTSVDVTGAGTAASPFVLTPIIDPVAGNLVSCSAAGLIAAYPARVLSPPRARVYSSVELTVAASTTVALAFDTEITDTDGFHDNSTNPSRLTNTLGITAVFTVGGCVALDMSGFTTDDWRLNIRKNGATLVAGRTRRIEVSYLDVMPLETDVLLAANDYVELTVFQTSSGTRTVRRRLPRASVFWMSYAGD